MTTISANSTIGIELISPSYSNPVVINPGVTVSSTGQGIYANTAGWTLQNAGSIVGNTAGVALYEGGNLTNQSGAQISGFHAFVGGFHGGAVTLVNAGSIAGYSPVNTSGAAHGIGIALFAGGSIVNQASSEISGYVGIGGYNSALTIVNAGTIAGNATASNARGVVLTAGGSVTNESSASIRGYTGIDGNGGATTVVNAGSIAGNTTSGVGIQLGAGGSVTNQSGGTISGYIGIEDLSSAATVVNAGSIAGDTITFDGVGVGFQAGGSVTNQSGAIISGYRGIYGGGTTAMTVVNYGSIAGNTTTVGGTGIELIAGGSVTNQSGGVITGHAGIVGITDTLTVMNTGSIAGSATILGGSGIALDAGGNVTNQSGGTISGYRGIYGGGTTAMTVVNYGSIVGGTTLEGVGIGFRAGGSVTNRSGATISGYRGIYGGGTTAVTIVNYGSIAGSATILGGSGIELRAGGSIINHGGGTISGETGIDGFISAVTVVNAGDIRGGDFFAGADLSAGSSVTNQSSATISGYTGIYCQSGALAVVNAGDIAGNATASTGIGLNGGGSVTNQNGGKVSGNIGIYGEHREVFRLSGFYLPPAVAVTVVNAGSIAGNTSSGKGVDLLTGGSVTNQSGGTISGYQGVYGGTGAAVTVMNAGSIAGRYSGVRLNGGGSVTNQTSAAITGVYGVSGEGVVTLVNAGSIAGYAGFYGGRFWSGAGVSFSAGGAVTNQSSATISGFIGISGGGLLTLVNAGSVAGSFIGVDLTRGGSVTNQSSALISGGMNGISGSGLLTLVNAGSVAGSFIGVDLTGGGSVANQSSALISGGIFGISGSSDVTVLNAGRIAGGPGAGVALSAGGSITNQSGGTISSSQASAVYITGAAGTVQNFGLISASGTTLSRGIALLAGGYVSNAVTSTISTVGSPGSQGIFTDGGSGTVVNGGLIRTSLAAAINLSAGGTVTNLSTGTINSSLNNDIYITGGAARIINAGLLINAATAHSAVNLFTAGYVSNASSGVIIASSNDGIFVTLGAGSVVNAGKILGPIGVGFAQGGSVTNQSGGTISGTSFGVLISSGAGTVVNAGTIDGLSAAVSFAVGAANRLVVDPGAVFNGTVNGANVAGATAVSTLELAPGVGTLSGLGTSIVDFGSIVFDPDASWFLSGDTSGFAGMISGFVAGDTIELTGVTATGSSFANGVLTLTEPSGSATLDLPGTFTTNSFVVTNVAGGAEITTNGTGTAIGNSTWNWIGGSINVDSPSDWTLTAGAGNASEIPAAGDTAVNAGTLLGKGVIAASLINNGTVEASSNGNPAAPIGAGLTIAGAVSGTGAITIEPGATLQIDGSLGGGQAIAFAPGTPETLILGSPTANIANPITGFAEGDEIEFSNGATLNSVSFVNGSTLAVSYHIGSGPVSIYDLTDVTLAAGTPESFTDFGDASTGYDYIMPTRYFNWTGATSTNFATASNWNFGTLVPGPYDFATFGGSGTVSGVGSGWQLGFNGIGWTLAAGTSLAATTGMIIGNGVAGALTIGSNSTIADNGYVDLGNGAGSSGTLTISGGGVLHDIAPFYPNGVTMGVGVHAASGTLVASTGTVVVTGSGSLLEITTNSMDIGDNGGSGHVTVSQGGTIISDAADSLLSDAFAIGRRGIGTVTATDAGSQLVANGAVAVGMAGTGTLIAQNQGSVTVGLDSLGNGGLSIGGNGTFANGAIYVGGTGMALATTGGDLFSQTDIVVGQAGAFGSLNVNDGGTVEAEQSLVVGAAATTAAGGIEITSAGTTTLAAATAFAGSGMVTVGADGLLRVDGAGVAGVANIVLGAGSGAAGVLDVAGAGALLSDTSGTIALGAAGSGTLEVGSGGSVAAAGISNASGGAILFSGGTIATTGASSNGGLLSGYGTFAGALANNGGTVMASGGTLEFTGSVTGAGALVVVPSATLLLDRGASSGAVTIDGGTLIAAGEIDAGQTGLGGLLVENQATVTTGTTVVSGARGLDIGRTVSAPGDAIVTGAKSLLDNTGEFVVGDTGFGSLNIEAGGSVTTTGTAGIAAVIANQASSSGSSVNVTGVGSEWQIAGALIVGNAGAGALNIAGGGAVTATSVDLAAQTNGSGNVSLSGTNSVLTTSGSLAVGDAGAGELSILNGAFVAIGGDLDVGQLPNGSGNVDIENATLRVAGNLNLGLGGGAGVVTVGTGGTLHVTGGLIGGIDSALNEFGAVDPNFDDGVNANVGVSGTQDFPGYVDGFASFTIDAGVTLTLESPSIYGGVSFVMGGKRDTTAMVLVLNAGSVSADTTVTFNNAHGTLVLGTDALGTIDIQANDSAAATFVANPSLGVPTVAQFLGMIDTFKAGDQIVVDTTAAASFVLNGATVEVVQNLATIGALSFDSAANAQTAFNTAGALVDVSCFAAGTRIRTVRGEVRVEELREGDVAITAIDGSEAPVVWVGHRAVDCARHPDPASVWPVRISAGAFGRGLPKRALTLSPDHAVYVNAVLVPVKHLINGTTIRQVKVDRVTYYHVELERHDVVYADGMPAESYLDVGDRANFANGGAVVRMHIDLAHHWEAGGCAPLVVYGAELNAVKAVVAAHEEELRGPAATSQSEAHSAAPGRGHESAGTRRSAA